MKLAFFNEGLLGLVEGERIYDVSAALAVLPQNKAPWLAQKGDLVITHLEVIRAAALKAKANADSYPVDDVRFLSPVQQPSKIIGVPVNYHAHVTEAEGDIATFSDRFRGSIEQQGFFLKANSALVGAGEGISLRFSDRRNDHEMELGVVIGKTVSKISKEEALSAIAGYAIALDMVVRGPEDRSLRKSGDSFAVLGPWLVTADEVPNPETLDFSLHVNGELRQASNTRLMIMKLAEQISYASHFYTLYPGDIIMTGTCEGVGPVTPGDVITCQIDGIAAMRVQIHPEFAQSEAAE